MPPSTRAEAERDLNESAFAVILRRLFQAVPAVLAAVFVDFEGECIDYVASVDPFEAKVTAAHMHMMIERLSAERLSACAGYAVGFELITQEREVWVRRVSQQYALVVILARGYDRSELRDAVARANREFRAEVELDTPAWEGNESLSVRVRASRRWSYAPDLFSVRGERHPIAAVLGRWTESVRPDAPPWVCFRVRTLHGEELTLAHDEHTEAWLVREP